MKGFLKKYYVREITPLKFHKFYHHIITPVNIVIMVYALVSMILEDTVDIFTVSYDLAILVCCILTFTGCFKFRSYAWIAIMCSFALELIYDMLYFVFLAPYGVTGLMFALSEVGWRLAFLLLMAIYYFKRQPLFFDPVPFEDLPRDLQEELGGGKKGSAGKRSSRSGASGSKKRRRRKK